MQLQKKIATVLRNIGSKNCLDKAELLVNGSHSKSTLHLTELELNSSNIIAIAKCFENEEEGSIHLIRSVSFSYNNALEDTGAISLAKYLPVSISELGLVKCGMSDAGGQEILKWMDRATKLRMICMEQNDFSDSFRLKLQKFRDSNPNVLVMS